VAASDNMSQAWPAKHHDLRAPSESYRSFSDIGWQRRLGLQGRIMGFRRAAEILHAAMLAEQSIRDLDTVIFPYAACWRHYVELRLKALLVQLRALSELPVEGRHHHRIDRLWQETRKLMIEHFPSERAGPAPIDKVINQLARLDPDGQAFRYAAERDGRETLRDVEQINHVAFQEAMVGVANYLDAADSGVSEYLSTKREMDSYYAAEFGHDWFDFN
jgi:hypothetical protein